MQTMIKCDFSELENGLLAIYLDEQIYDYISEFGLELLKKWPHLRILCYIGQNPMIVREIKQQNQ